MKGKDLDAQVEAFLTRPVDAAVYVPGRGRADAQRPRGRAHTVNVHALLPIGVHVTSVEDGTGWLAFFRDATARALSGVALVTSDAHRGLVEAIDATLPGATWQRRTIYAANPISATPKSAWGG